jgi:hypothetical protein
MTTTPQLAKQRPVPRSAAARRFPACAGRFDDREDRTTIDGLAKWVELRYREALARRPSMHVYVRSLPGEVIEQVDRLRESPAIRDAILRHFGAACAITPMKHTDELYISHYNRDYAGDHGLFARHYDGNLRFLPVGAVVRALIYLQSDATYRVVFIDSGLEHAFATYEYALLDFHRELHWVAGAYRPDDRQRILLKCNYLITPNDAAFARRALLGANTAVFYVVKAAMEYSKSPKTPSRFAVGLVCNLARLLNNVHPLVPLAVLLLAVAAAGWGIGRLIP